jgi:hypothetical protein
MIGEAIEVLLGEAGNRNMCVEAIFAPSLRLRSFAQSSGLASSGCNGSCPCVMQRHRRQGDLNNLTAVSVSRLSTRTPTTGRRNSAEVMRARTRLVPHFV